MCTRRLPGLYRIASEKSVDQSEAVSAPKRVWPAASFVSFQEAGSYPKYAGLIWMVVELQTWCHPLQTISLGRRRCIVLALNDRWLNDGLLNPPQLPCQFPCVLASLQSCKASHPAHSTYPGHGRRIVSPVLQPQLPSSSRCQILPPVCN